MRGAGSSIALLTAGTTGDVRPLVALGCGLRDAGWSVTLVAGRRAAPLVEERGLQFAPLASDPSDLLLSDPAALALDGGLLRGALASLRYLHAARPAYERMLTSAWAACRHADALIVGLASAWGEHIAAALGVPCVWAPLQPVTPTRAFGSPLLPLSHPLPAAGRLLSHRVAELALWLPWRATLRQWRRRQLGLSAAPADPFALARSQGRRFVYGFSPSVVPPPRDWPATSAVAGYWFLDAPAGERLAPELERFLERGSPPVCIGFGSMGARRPAEDAALALEALRLAGRRGILLGGREMAGMVGRQEDVIVVGYAPHDLLLPRVAVVVHHGGAGTTGAGLRAGVPAVTIPVAVDQRFWGWRVAALGAGPEPIARGSALPARLAAAIVAADGERYRARAQALGQLVRGERGVARGVELIAGQL